MALTETIQLPLGIAAPAFNLPDVKDNQSKTLEELKGKKGTLVAFICNHCPYVQHVLPQFTAMANSYLKEGVQTICISSNDVDKYPDDSPAKMKELASEFEFKFPYLYDESQEVAKSYQAACTPDFMLYDENLKCVYRGRFDDSTPGNNKEVTGKDLKKAIEALLNNEGPLQKQYPSMGCNIKWK